jgi:SAM-dependent methyltransferase
VLQFVDRAKLLREAHRILAPGGLLMIGVYNAPGRVLEKLFTGYKAGGIENHAAKFALRSLRQGPLFDEGNGTFGSVAHLGEVLNRFGFDLDPTRPPEEEMHRRAKPLPDIRPLLDDLPAFADRFERDPAFADEMVSTPGVAFLLPINLHAGAIRR